MGEILKWGTKVRTLSDTDSEGTKLFPVGTIGQIAYVISEDEEVENYLIESVDGGSWWYSRDMFEIMED